MVAYNLIFTVYFIKSLLMPQFNHFSFYGYLVWSKITLFLEMTLIFVFVICSYIKIFSDFFRERIRWELVSVYRSTVTFFFISSVHLSYACNIKQFEDRWSESNNTNCNYNIPAKKWHTYLISIPAHPNPPIGAHPRWYSGAEREFNLL